MRVTLLFLLIYFSFTTFAQIQIHQTEFDLGEISLLNSDIVDFNVTNNTSNSVFLLRIEAEKQVGFQYTTKTFQPGKEEGIRIKLNPNKKGRIEQTVKLYFSSNSQPIKLKIKAIVKALPKNNRTACPTFGSALKHPTGVKQPIAKIQQLTLLLVDESTQVMISSDVEDENNSEINPTKESIEIQKDVAVEENLSRSSNSKPLKKQKVRLNPTERRNAPSLGTILFGKTGADSTKVDSEPKDDAVQEEETIQNETLITEVQSNEKNDIVKDDEKSEQLLDESFKPNNIVFLIDASTSMREEQKMDILKKAMIELLEPLRAIDYITIVTYSGEAKVVLPTSQGNLKEEIAKQIENLQADGSTNAVKGIKKAIQAGKSNFLEEGNNQIFLASDGAFNIGENNIGLRKKIKKTAEEGLTITVLGIKNDNWTNKSLKEIATLGKGDLIKIKSMRDAGKVLQSMKRKAMR